METKFEVKKSGLKAALAHVLAGIGITGLLVVAYRAGRWRGSKQGIYRLDQHSRN